MSAERLREAARVLRERAEAATPGPWEARHGGYYSWLALYDDEEKIPAEDSLPSFEPGGSATPADFTYVATMHPGVGLALADLLDDQARGYEEWDRRYGTDAAYRIMLPSLRIADLILGDAQ